MPKTSIDILQVIRLLRRQAQAIASGLIDAHKVDDMTDADLLKAFDDEAFAALEAKLLEADRIAGVEPGPPAEPEAV